MIRIWINKKNGQITEHILDTGEAIVLHGVTIRGETVEYTGGPNAVVEGAVVVPETVVDGVEAKREESKRDYAKVPKKADKRPKRGRPTERVGTSRKGGTKKTKGN